jgi:hypothetical protein
MKTFRNFLLTEAYDRSKTVENFRDKIEERLRTPRALKTHEGVVVSHNTMNWDDHLQRHKENPSAYGGAVYDDSDSVAAIAGIRSRGPYGQPLDTHPYNLLDTTTPIKELDHFKSDRDWRHKRLDDMIADPSVHKVSKDIAKTAKSPEGNSGVILGGSAAPYYSELHVTNRQYDAGMSVRDVVYDNFMRKLEGALPHPKYVQAALKMYTNPKGGIARTEDLFSTVASAFHDYHAIASKGKLDSTKWAAMSRKQEIHDQDTKIVGQLTQHISDEEGNGHPVGYKVYVELEAAKKNVKDLAPLAKGPKHTEFNRFTSLEQLQHTINHPQYKHILNPVPKVSDAKEGEDYDVIHDNDEATVYHAKTEHGAWVLAHCPHTGEKASWCTAPNPRHKGAHNYFRQYHEQGPLIIVHPKHPTRPGEIYQIHRPSGQWMDENDNDMDERLDSDGNHGDPSIARGRGAGMGLYKFNHHDIAQWSAHKEEEMHG